QAPTLVIHGTRDNVVPPEVGRRLAAAIPGARYQLLDGLGHMLMVTGARQVLPPGLESFVGRVKQSATLPLAVGFGISTPEQAVRVAAVADGVIVGSRLIQIIREDGGYAAAREFIRGLRQALG
ncbi:MAG: tryptophan synthase subunit alpha, partial [Dehalococcoidia bacterium]|nr:tryptophan synthase subunit alpha [Dehalococcoidia bacterium]